MMNHILEKTRNLRKYLHGIPELAFEERKTMEFSYEEIEPFPALHTVNYEYPDEIMESVIRLYDQLVKSN